jgi:signal transduction histidine kinase
VKKIIWSATLLSVGIGVIGWYGAFSFLLSANYLPHRYCYLIQPGLVWTNVTMDGLIAVSYLVIFMGLFWMAAKLRHRAEIKSYLWIFLSFGTFIVACGMTHVMEMITIWWPVYRLSAAVKVVCAAASVPTAILFVRIAPAVTRNMERFLSTLSATQYEKDQALVSLIAAEKLAVAGRISASIAHEIKNPLESVGNVLHLLRTSPGFPAEMLPLMDTADSEMARAVHIAGSTLSLYRESLAPVEVSLTPLIQSVIDLQTADFVHHNIQVQPRLRTPRAIYAYPGELRQIFINLIHNATAAIGENGSIFVRVQPRLGGYSITIADNGPGIEPANRAKLFSLFFTTKGESGTGLGLWLVQSLVEKHGGRIRFRSRIAGESIIRGSLFNIWLPLGNPQYSVPLTFVGAQNTSSDPRLNGLT